LLKLLYAPTSPYVRKVMAVAHETGQLESIEPVFALANPIGNNDELNADNPLGKIPVLITPDGPLFDSRVICEYLDARSHGHRVFPKEGPARWKALRQQALADGLLDAALAARYERLSRPKDMQWSGWRDAQLAKIARALAAMEEDLPDQPTIGAIGFGCALGYIDFRFPEIAWRSAHPLLEAWFGAFSERPSMHLTEPREA
jgi:glutathione S-transferase